MNNAKTQDANAIDLRTTVGEWLEIAMCEGEEDVYEGKRRDTRYTWNCQMELLVDDEILYVVSRDISQAGIGLVSKKRLCLNALVHIRHQETDPWVPAYVTHVTDTIGAQKVGIELSFDI